MGVSSETSYPAQVRTGVFVTLSLRLRVKHGLSESGPFDIGLPTTQSPHIAFQTRSSRIQT
jgi:hypothetical protein